MACCNPFDISGHDWSSRKKNLRPVQPWMCEKAPIAMGGKICDSCRKKLAKEPTPSMAVPSVLSSSGSEAEEAKQYHEEKAISSMNKCFEDIGETPFSRRKARQKTTPDKRSKNSPKHCRTLRLETMEVKCFNSSKRSLR